MVKVIFEDDSLRVIDKPPGLVVTEIPGLLARLDSRLARLAHRLDKDTSGLILIAKTQAVLGYEITSLLIRPNQIHLREFLLKEKAYLLARPLEWQ